MLNVPSEVKRLFEQDSISKNFRIHFPNGEFRDLVNADIVSESVVFTESLNSSEGLKFGLCEGSTLEFQTYFNQNIRNLKIEASIEIDVSSIKTRKSKYLSSVVITIDNPSSSGSYSGHYQYRASQDGTYRFMSFERVLESVQYQGGIIYPSHTVDYDYIDVVLKQNETIRINGVAQTARTYGLQVKLTYGEAIYPPDYAQTSSDVPYRFYRVPYGIFYIDSCKQDATTSIRRVVAYQNKYKNQDFTLINVTSLSPIDKLKFDCRTSNSKFAFNYLLAYIHSFNDKDYIMNTIYKEMLNLSEDSRLDIQFNSSMTTAHLLCASSNMSYDSYLQFSDLGYDARKMGKLSYISPSFIVADEGYRQQHSYVAEVTGIAVAFSSLNYLRTAPGIIEGEYEGHTVNFTITDSDTNYFEFTWDVEDFRPDLDDIEDSINNILYSYEGTSHIHTTEDMVKQLITPFVRPLGFLPTKYINRNYDAGVSVETPHYYFDNINNKTGKLVIIPHLKGATDYQGISTGGNTKVFPVNGSKLGCVGIQLFIPTNITLRIDYDETQDRQYTLIDASSVQMNTCVCLDIGFLETKRFSTYFEQEEEKISTTVGTATKTATTYNCAGKANEFETEYLLQKSFVSLFELGGKLLKYDRLTNKLITQELVASYDGLYPSTDIYPAQDLYPKTDNIFRITRSMWKSVWCDEIFKPFYQKVKASYKVIDYSLTSWSDTSYGYTIVTDKELLDAYNFPDYDLSNNYFIQNGILVDGFCLQEDIETLLTRLGEKLKSIIYYPLDVDMRAAPFLESGDAIMVLTKDKGIVSYVLRHRITGVQALMDKIETR